MTSSMKIESKFKVTTMSVLKLVPKYDVNVRNERNYDLATMSQQIKAAGRILKAIIIKADGTVLSGNRRVRAGQMLRNDPTCPVELAEQLDKVPVMVYSDLSPEEEMVLILDHGGERPLAKSEVVTAVWRLDKQFYTSSQILAWMYYSLALYTGNTRKLGEMPVDAKAKDAFLKKWFHGTLDNFILAAARMTGYVREQFMLSRQHEDGLLPEGVKVEMKLDRARITELSKAKNADLSKNGTGWTPKDGGEQFNALVEKFKCEDANGGSDEKAAKRLSVKDLNERMAHYKSPVIRAAFGLASGDVEQGKLLAEMDEVIDRQQMVCDTIAKRLPEIKDEKVAAILRAIIGTGAAGELELAIDAYITPTA